MHNWLQVEPPTRILDIWLVLITLLKTLIPLSSEENKNITHRSTGRFFACNLFLRALQSLQDGTNTVVMEAGTPQMDAMDYDYQFTVGEHISVVPAHTRVSTV